MTSTRKSGFWTLSTCVHVSRTPSPLWTSTCGRHELHIALLKQLVQWPSGPKAEIRLYDCNLFKTVLLVIYVADLKIAKISPTFKARDKNLITNYKPISVLPFFSEVMEKLMSSRLTDYMNKYVPLSVTQYGFQRGLSTYMALMDMQTNISEAMNQNKFSLGVFFDISFDTVNHKLLIQKLEYFGIRRIAKSWFENYLTGGSQYVCIRGTSTNTSIITCRVPQGSMSPFHH